MRQLILLWTTFFCMNVLYAQQDTLSSQSEEVVITATRTERKLTSLTTPVTVIPQRIIQQAGSLRLSDILKEQTGLFLTTGFGAGLQMQGLDPAYTLILLDGEPLVGRTAGVLDLNRITVGNIRKIEIVRGPSSSLYGSEAIAGVVNIITDRSYLPKATGSLRFGTYNTLDANLQGAKRVGKLGLNSFLNFYRTDGYSIRPYSSQRPVLPIERITPQFQLGYDIGKATKFNLSVRFNRELIKNELSVSNNGQVTKSSGRELNHDLNIAPVWATRFNSRWQTTFRGYATVFKGDQKLLSNNLQTYSDIQKHQFFRIENQTEFAPDSNWAFSFGMGHITELLNSTRYSHLNDTKSNQVQYGFVQADFVASQKLRLVGGLRYDYNRQYQAALSPKLSMRYQATKNTSFTASIGRGFRAPDFSKLFLNFTNTSAGSYSVYGTVDAVNIITELQTLGQIAYVRSDFYKIKALKPELSTGVNVGANQKISKYASVWGNLFYNDINNLIDVREVAGRIVDAGPPQQIAQVFSYINIDRAFSTGLEAGADMAKGKWLTTLGGQILFSGDRAEINEIKAGKVFTRNADLSARAIGRSEYTGLPNRSRYMINGRLQYEVPNNWFANIRVIWRSRFVPGGNDTNGNGVYDVYDQYANGFALVNMAAAKNLRKFLRIQVGIDNLLNYEDRNYLPNMAGRSIYIACHFNFINQKSNK